MPDTTLSQSEGDLLLKMPKMSVSTHSVNMPSLGGQLELGLVSKDKKEEFIINYNQNSINLVKRNHHIRSRRSIGLARLDLFGPPHQNPDGNFVGPNHLHLYREGFDLKWAYEVPLKSFSDLDDSIKTLQEFMTYCNVVKFPELIRDLFS